MSGHPKPAVEKPAVELPAGTPRFYSVKQVAAMLGMSPMTVYREITAGQFPAVRIRGRLIIPAKAVEAMVEAAVADCTEVNAADFVPVAPGAGQAAGGSAARTRTPARPLIRRGDVYVDDPRSCPCRRGSGDLTCSATGSTRASCTTREESGDDDGF